MQRKAKKLRICPTFSVNSVVVTSSESALVSLTKVSLSKPGSVSNQPLRARFESNAGLFTSSMISCHRAPMYGHSPRFAPA
jgi:hypothetical protein